MKHYTLVDYATQAYLVVVGLLILLFHGGQVPYWPWLLAAHGLVMVLLHGLICFHARGGTGWGWDFLRHFYPVLLYTGFYRETGELHHMFVTGFLDSHFIRLEQAVFGFQPSLAFMDALPYLAVSELFYAAYFTYYVMIVGIGLALFLRSREQFFHYVSVVSLVFYVCYLTYIFLPVMGPRAFYRDPAEGVLSLDVLPALIPGFPEAVQAGVFHQIMAVIYRFLESPGAAFPSSHVAVAVTTLWFSFRYLRPIRYVHLVDVVLLCLSTVYCRYHYAVDVVAGLVAAGVLAPLSSRLYFRLRHLGGGTVEASAPGVEGMRQVSRSRAGRDYSSRS